MGMIYIAEVKKIKAIFEKLGYEWVEPYETTEGELVRGEKGKHSGLYYIYPEKNFYFGKAQSGLVKDRHITHWPKLQVDLSRLYGRNNLKIQADDAFPEAWREGVARFLLEGDIVIPKHFASALDEDGRRIVNEKGRKLVEPRNLEFEVTHKVDVDKLPVLVWDLNDFGEDAINEIEKEVIVTIWPYCNTETHKKRKSKS